jgi:hypothetical protein
VVYDGDGEDRVEALVPVGQRQVVTQQHLGIIGTQCTLSNVILSVKCDIQCLLQLLPIRYKTILSVYTFSPGATLNNVARGGVGHGVTSEVE